MSRMHRLIGLLLLLCTFCFGGSAGTLDIYFIDVEGGQATLIVTSAGKSMLVDAGWPGFEGRDASRILAAAKQAGIRQIDYLVVTHYHTDHVGGVLQLAERIPVATFVDHGPASESQGGLLDAYTEVRKHGKHMVVKPGDSIPLEGALVEVLASDGRTRHSETGPRNPLCLSEKLRDEDHTENARSVGFILVFGEFRFLDLADLTWNKELELACPSNVIGRVDLYLVTHHTTNLSGPAAIVHALRPRVAIMNNGAKKGGSPEAWRIVKNSPGLEDLWQLHFALAGGQENNSAEQYIANVKEDCQGYGLKVSARQDGSFTIVNSRNGYTKTYERRADGVVGITK